MYRTVIIGVINFSLEIMATNQFSVTQYACDFQPDKKTNLALNLFMCYHVFAQIHKTTCSIHLSTITVVIIVQNTRQTEQTFSQG